MEISALPSNVRAADLSFEQVASNPKLSEEAKITEASRQFEAVLLRQILTEATKTVFKSSTNPESSSDGIYQDMITNTLADKISRAGGLGLSRVLNQQLKHELRTPAPPTENAPHV